MADSLERTMRARVRLIRNGADLYDQVFYEPDESYTESTHQRLILATNMATAQEVDLAGVATGETMFLQTDREITVAVDAIGSKWTLKDNGAVMLVGSFTHLYLRNESTTNQATVELVVTD